MPDDAPSILHTDERWMVIAKPARWHTLRGASPDEPSVEDWLATNFPHLENVGDEHGILHRLDRMTTGCLLVALDTEAHADLVDRLRGTGPQGIAKQYLAIVDGKVWTDGRFDLYFTSRYRRSKKVTITQSGRPAQRGQCIWNVVHPLDSGTLLRVNLLGPGRRHQIRAGLASVGYPILGDTLYGGPDWHGGLALHAWRLRIDEQWITCPPPTDWQLPDDLDLAGIPQ